MPISMLSKGTSKQEFIHSEESHTQIHDQKEISTVVQDVAEVTSQSTTKPRSLSQLSGFDFASIDQGIVRIRAPLNGGKFGIPGPFADAIIKVKNNSVAQLSLGVGKKNGKTQITGANISFQPPIKLKNPASAFKPTKPGLVSRLMDVDYIKDKAADVVISGIQIAKNGQIHLDGYLKVGFLGRKDLSLVVATDSLPRVDLSIDSLKNRASNDSSFDIKKLLTAVGGALGEATFSIDAHTEPRQMDFNAMGIHAWTDTSCAQVNLHGRARLTRQNSLNLNIDYDSEIRLQNGQIDLGGEIRISDLSEKNLSIESHIAFAVDPHPIHADFRVSDLTTLNLDLPKGGNRVTGHAFVFRNDKGEVTLKDASSISAKIAGKLNGDLVIHTGQLKAQLHDGSFSGELKANLSYDKTGATISSGELNADVAAHDLTSEIHGINIAAPGEYRAHLAAKSLSYYPRNKVPSGLGEGSASMTPSQTSMAQMAGLGPLNTQFTFNLRGDGTLRINQLQKGITEFLKPFANFILPTSNRNYIPGENCAPIGSSIFRKRCEDIGNAKIRKHDSVELLVDGIASLPKRLELIASAKKSICMQTMVLKDDESGGQIVDALCDAVRRGVDVRVIVDALGNSTSLMDVIGMNPVYGRLQGGGVKLQVHNNSIGEGVRKVLNALSHSERIGEFLNFEDLMDPKKLFSTLNLVVNAAIGDSPLALKPDDKRELVCGLTQILSGGKLDYSPELVSKFAKVTDDNVLELAEILELLKQNAHLNFRWHEKYLIADQQTAIVGGLNSADEYLLGGNKKTATVRGVESETWRDTDVLLKGESARDAFSHFADNWKHVSNETMEAESSELLPQGDYRIQMVHSRPGIAGDSNITDLMIECLGSLAPGEKALIENAYFLPTGRAKNFEDALISAAQRGADVRVVINSMSSIDVKPVAQGAVFSERRLLENGVRVFERTGTRMMHSKCATFGSKVSIVGSWNADNRSSSLNSESAAFIHSNRFANKIERMITADMNERVAKEIHIEDIEHLPIKTEIRNALSANFSDLL